MSSSIGIAAHCDSGSGQLPTSGRRFLVVSGFQRHHTVSRRAPILLNYKEYSNSLKCESVPGKV